MKKTVCPETHCVKIDENNLHKPDAWRPGKARFWQIRKLNQIS